MYILLIIAAYLIGSVSSAVWVSKTFFKVDIRQHGSKNAGATNVLRVLGWKAGLPVFVWDFAKGAGAVCLIFLTPLPSETNLYVSYQIALGIAAVLGHIFPVFASFKGGKGVATIAGVIFAIHPYAVLIVLGVFVACLLITRYVSLSSIIAALSFPFIVIVIFGEWVNMEETITLKIFSVVAMAIILLTHRKNIMRLRKGAEGKIVFRKNPSIELPKKQPQIT